MITILIGIIITKFPTIFGIVNGICLVIIISRHNPNVNRDKIVTISATTWMLAKGSPKPLGGPKP